LGKTREDWLKQALEYYRLRVEPYCPIELVTLPDTSIRQVNNPAEVMQREAVTILNTLKANEYVILLDEQGEQQNSLEFATNLSRLSDRKIVFVIGGVYGTAQEVTQRADQVIGLSRMTFTHQMVRLVLIEQIYRAMMINHNKNYHY